MTFSVSGNRTKLVRTSHVVILRDCSSSMGDVVHEFAEKGLPAICDGLRSIEDEGVFRFKLGLVDFSLDFEEAMPMQRVDSAVGAVAKGIGIAVDRSVTRPVSAVEHCIEMIDGAKREDPVHANGLLMIVTDGKPTDCEGRLQALPDSFIRMIKAKNRSGKGPNVVAVGLRPSSADALGKGLANRLQSEGIIEGDEIVDRKHLVDLVGKDLAQKIEHRLDERVDLKSLLELGGGNAVLFRKDPAAISEIVCLALDLSSESYERIDANALAAMDFDLEGFSFDSDAFEVVG